MYKIIERLRENPMAIVVSAFVAIGGLLYGYDTGIIAGIIDMKYVAQVFGNLQLDGTYHLAARDKSLIVSILSVGTFCGALLGSPAGDLLGRRWAMLVSCLVFLIGVLFQLISVSLALFVLGRLTTGLGLGLISCIIPMYQSECAPKWFRGGLVSAYQWFITIGFLLGAVATNATKNMYSIACYQIPISIQLFWLVILGFGTLFLPESPRYLVMKGRIEEACQAQAKLNWSSVDDENVNNDIKQIVENVEFMSKYGSGTYVDCFRMGPQKNLLRTLVGIFLQAWQQLSGINFILYYGTSFYHACGINRQFEATILINGINVIMTVPGMLLMDKIGRRKILIFGAIGMAASEFIIAVMGVALGHSHDIAQKILISFVCFFIAFYASSWGPAAWVVTSEIYPSSIRAKCMSLSTASNWLWNFVVTFSVPYIVDKDKGNLGSYVFFIWGTACIGGLLFAIFCIWETKGLSLEQIDELICNSSPLSSDKMNSEIKQAESEHARSTTAKYQAITNQNDTES